MTSSAALNNLITELRVRVEDIWALTLLRTCLEVPLQSRWWHLSRISLFFLFLLPGNPPSPIFHCFGQGMSLLMSSKDISHR